MAKITTKIVLNFETGEVLEHRWYNYFGPIELACGASSQEKGAFANEQKVSGLLTSAFQQVMGTNMNILDSLTGALKPIVSAGADQFGFTPAEEAARRTEATERLASAGGQATNAVRSAEASRGGGNVYLPSGSEASIEASLAQDTAQKEATAQLDITKQGYDVGRQKFFEATNLLAEAPGKLEGPITGMGSAAESAAASELKGGEAITAANRAWEGPVAGLIGAGLSFIPKPQGAKGGSSDGSSGSGDDTSIPA